MGPSPLQRLRDYFFPHRRNGYKPHVFRLRSVAFLILGVLVLEGAYFADIGLLGTRSNFLASVLPGALVALTNDDRAANSAPAVSENATLDQAARLAAEDMAAKGYFAHVSPTGVTPWDWLDQVGYKYTYAGENLAVDFTDSTAVESAWMASPSHHANIVKPQYTEVGIGVATGVYQGQQTAFVVQFFATPAPAASAGQASPTKTPVAKIETPIAATTSVAKAPDATQIAASPAPASTVLGTEVSPPAPSLLGSAAAAPTHTITLILSILAVAVLILLAIAIAVRVRLQYLEIIGGGLFLLIVLIGLIIYDGSRAGTPQVPTNVHDSAV